MAEKITERRISEIDAIRFRFELSQTIDTFSKWERKTRGFSSTKKQKSFLDCRRTIENNIANLPEPDQLLFDNLLNLVAYKYDIGPLNKMHKKNAPDCCFVAMIGPIAVGKTTLIKTLKKDIHADYAGHEPLSLNCYWQPSLKDSNYMLRSQIYFLLSNIFTDMEAKHHKQHGSKIARAVSDTCTWADALMWVEWYHKTKRISQKDYETYERLLVFLKNIIPKPDLLVALIPDNVDNLYKGMVNRQKHDRKRKNEKVFAKKDLVVLNDIARSLVDRIPQELKIPVLRIVINPNKMYSNPGVRNKCVSQIRKKLKLFDKLS